MKPNRWMTLILITSLGTALFAWSHAQVKARKAVRLVPEEDTSLTLTGTIVPAITTPISRRNWNLAIPLNTWVKRGDVIGIAESQAAPTDRDSARQELADARAAERRAIDGVRQAGQELGASQEQAGSMEEREARAETAGPDTNAAVRGREAAETAADSIPSNLAAVSIETDEWEAKAQEAQAELRKARTRRDAAEVVFRQTPRGSKNELIVSPADGIIVVSGQPEGTSFGIASDPRQLCAYAMVREADLMAVEVGQPSLIVLDGQPALTFHAKVRAISDTPVDSPEGSTYQVTFAVDNPGGIWLSGVAMHARLVRSTQ
jgi:multidrug resistance efflux pump